MALLECFVSLIKKYFPWVLLTISLCVNVYLFNLEKVVYKDKIVEIPVKVSADVKTDNKVTVKSKENINDPDLVVNTKQDLKVSLNGKVVDLKPEKKESFNFGKDYAELENSTSFNLNIENKPLEPSWGVGVGYNTDKKLEGIFTARIKKTPLHVWATSDGHHTAGGIMFSTNYK